MLERGELGEWDVPDADYRKGVGVFPKTPDFDKILAQYKSGVDVPFSIFWKQVKPSPHI
jgi:hypothetical protein